MPPTRTSSTVNAITVGRNSLLHSREAYIGTTRGRVGYAFDRFLVYGTGGSLQSFGSGTKMQTGYACGGGGEYAWPTSSVFNVLKSDPVTVRAEFPALRAR